jgi:hypothetical protein
VRPFVDGQVDSGVKRVQRPHAPQDSVSQQASTASRGRADRSAGCEGRTSGLDDRLRRLCGRHALRGNLVQYVGYRVLGRRRGGGCALDRAGRRLGLIGGASRLRSSRPATLLLSTAGAQPLDACHHGVRGSRSSNTLEPLFEYAFDALLGVVFAWWLAHC